MATTPEQKVLADDQKLLADSNQALTQPATQQPATQPQTQNAAALVMAQSAAQQQTQHAATSADLKDTQEQNGAVVRVAPETKLDADALALQRSIDSLGQFKKLPDVLKINIFGMLGLQDGAPLYRTNKYIRELLKQELQKGR